MSEWRAVGRSGGGGYGLVAGSDALQIGTSSGEAQRGLANILILQCGKIGKGLGRMCK